MSLLNIYSSMMLGGRSSGPIVEDGFINKNFVNLAITGLPAGWVNVGSTYTEDVNGIHFSGYPGSLPYIRSNIGTLTERCTLEVTFTYDSTYVTNSGLLIGFKSYNAWGYDNQDLKAGIVNDKLGFATRSPDGYIYSTGSIGSINSGDLLKYKLVRVGFNLTLTAYNITQGWDISMTHLSSTAAPYIFSNSANHAVWHIGGNVTLKTFKHTLNIPADLDLIIVGDSITQGQDAGTAADRYAQLVGDFSKNILSGGGADTSVSVVNRLTELVTIVNSAITVPRFLVMIGGNDLLFGLSAASVIANLKTIKSSLEAAGAEFIICYPTPRTGAGALMDAINAESTFASIQKIDANTSMKNGNRDTLLTIYDSGDALHPNHAGHAQAAAVINAAL